MVLASVCWRTLLHLGPGSVFSLPFAMYMDDVKQGVYKSAVGGSIAEPIRGHCTASPSPGPRAYRLWRLRCSDGLMYMKGIVLERM